MRHNMAPGGPGECCKWHQIVRSVYHCLKLLVFVVFFRFYRYLAFFLSFNVTLFVISHVCVDSVHLI